MQGINQVLQIALSMVSQSLLEPIPCNIDHCLFGFRFIVEFSGKNDNVEVLTSIVQDSDWILDNELTMRFSEEVEKLASICNIEYYQSLKQALYIVEDRTYYY